MSPVCVKEEEGEKEEEKETGVNRVRDFEHLIISENVLTFIVLHFIVEWHPILELILPLWGCLVRAVDEENMRE